MQYGPCQELILLVWGGMWKDNLTVGSRRFISVAPVLMEVLGMTLKSQMETRRLASKIL